MNDQPAPRPDPVAVLAALQSVGPDAAGQEALQTVLTHNQPDIQANFVLFQLVVFAAIQLNDLPAAQRALAIHLPKFQAVTIHFETERPIDLNTIRWDATPDGAHRFGLCPRLLELDRNWMYTIVSRWVSCLRLAHRYDPAAGAGTAFLDVGDWSNGPAMCFSENRTQALLIPDSSFLGSDGYRAARDWGEPATAPAWDARAPIAIWRGSSTGVFTDAFADLPRARLSALSIGSTVLDAGISDVVQPLDPAALEAIHAAGLCRPHVPMPEHLKYKFQIDIDGNTNSWPGLFQKLLTGSPVLKVLSPEKYRQWYYPRLVPWQNYVPILSDLSDLLPILEYLRANDALARRIGEAGRALAMDMTMDAELDRALPTVQAAFALGTFVCRGL